jgi:signal transduction histidine kinase
MLRARITACLEKKRFRDKEIEYHKTLAETNEQLKIANSNYMQMLGFVTHELKAPLSAMQSMISLVMNGFAGEVPEKIGHYLLRIKRNCEELQDMVKNYLDLSRAERGELVANKVEMDFSKEVVVPSVDQARAIFDSRGMTLRVEAPETLPISAPNYCGSR